MKNSIDSSSSSSPPSPRDGGDGFRLKRKTCSRGHDGLVGVSQRLSGRWVAEIKDSVQKVRLWLGTFDTAQEAACAYDDAARFLHRANARTNFELPDESSRAKKCATDNLEPFSFEEACGIEGEADSFVGALRAKLLHGKTTRQFNSSTLQPSLYGSSHQPSPNKTTTRNKDTRAAPLLQSLQLQSPPALKTSNPDNDHGHSNPDNDGDHQTGIQWHNDNHTEILPWGSRVSYEDLSSTITTKPYS